jgi:hypothetical protein
MTLCDRLNQQINAATDNRNHQRIDGSGVTSDSAKEARSAKGAIVDITET